MCSRWQIGMLLGFKIWLLAFFAKTSPRPSLARCATCVSTRVRSRSVLEKVASRSEETFYDDVLLVDEHGLFPWPDFHPDARAAPASLPARKTLRRLEEKQREINAKNEQMREELQNGQGGTTCDAASTVSDFSGRRTSPNSSALRFSHRYQPESEVSGDFLLRGTALRRNGGCPHLRRNGSWCAFRACHYDASRHGRSMSVGCLSILGGSSRAQ